MQVWVHRNHQCQWHDSESERTAGLILIWKQKRQLWQRCVCVHTPFLTLHYLCCYQYTYKSVVCPLLREVFWMSFKPHQTYKWCSTKKCHWNTVTEKKPHAVLPVLLVFSLYSLPWKAKGWVRALGISKGQRQGCSRSLHSKFSEFREINIAVITSFSVLFCAYRTWPRQVRRS